MPNPHRYFVEEREDCWAVKGEHNEIASELCNTELQAQKQAHHYAGRGGVVEFKDEQGRFAHCLCPRCRRNR